MIKYVVKIDGKYLTRYGTLTAKKSCAERHKEYGDAECAADEYADCHDCYVEIEEVECD